MVISVPEVLLSYRLSAGSISANQRKIMVKKNIDLRGSIGINSDDYRQSIGELGHTLGRYEDFDFDRIRKLLHLRDLLSVTSQYNFAQSERKLVLGNLIKLSLSVESILDVLPFAAHTLKRRTVRKFL